MMQSSSGFQSRFSFIIERYAAVNGRDKVGIINSKVLNSGKLAQLHGMTIRDGVVPTAADFLAVLHSMPYFMFASRETCITASAIAIDRWNKDVNTYYQYADEDQMIHKLRSLYKVMKMPPPF